MAATLTDRVRAALAGMAEIRALEVAERLGVQTKAEVRRIAEVLRELAKRGELQRQEPGVYRPTPRQPGQPTKQEVMWRVLRARRTVTVADLQELAGVDRDYARQFLRHLQKRQVVQEVAGPAGRKYRLAADPVELPRNEEKAAYLRRRREAQKRALAALDAVFAAVAEARMAIAEID